MKQTINIEQYEKLSERGKECLKEWWEPKIDLSSPNTDMSSGVVELVEEDRMYPLLSIGQMIEFLNSICQRVFIRTSGRGWDVLIGGLGTFPKLAFSREGLCDALWEATKEISETDEK